MSLSHILPLSPYRLVVFGHFHMFCAGRHKRVVLDGFTEHISILSAVTRFSTFTLAKSDTTTTYHSGQIPEGSARF